MNKVIYLSFPIKIIFSLIVFSYGSHPHLSSSTNGAESTIVPTTPVDPSIPNLNLISSTLSMPDHQYFQKSTSMRFAKLIEHPST
jgi:hypothetical protein